jgi:hypothetical protein
MIVEFAGVHLVGRLAHRTNAGLDWTDPLSLRMNIGGNIGVLMRSLIGNVSDPVEMLPAGCCSVLTGLP